MISERLCEKNRQNKLIGNDIPMHRQVNGIVAGVTTSHDVVHPWSVNNSSLLLFDVRIHCCKT